jgi:hypothetical protein
VGFFSSNFPTLVLVKSMVGVDVVVVDVLEGDVTEPVPSVVDVVVVLDDPDFALLASAFVAFASTFAWAPCAFTLLSAFAPDTFVCPPPLATCVCVVFAGVTDLLPDALVPFTDGPFEGDTLTVPDLVPPLFCV